MNAQIHGEHGIMSTDLPISSQIGVDPKRKGGREGGEKEGREKEREREKGRGRGGGGGESENEKSLKLMTPPFIELRMWILPSKCMKKLVLKTFFALSTSASVTLWQRRILHVWRYTQSRGLFDSIIPHTH